MTDAPVRRPRRFLRIFLGALVLLGLATVVGARWNMREGRSFLADLVSRAASSPGMKIEIGAFEDPLSARPLLRDVSIADAEGVWLTIDHVALAWSPLALFALEANVERFEIGRIAVARRPAPSPAPSPVPGPAPAAAAKSGGGFSVPHLPVRVRLGRLALGEIALAEPVLGAAAVFSATGDAALRSDAGHVALEIKRLDAPGEIVAKGELTPSSNKLRFSLTAQEPEGGMIVRLAQIPDLPALDVALTGEGTLDDLSARLAATAGEIDANGAAHLSRAGAARRLDLDLSARIAPLLPKSVAVLFSGATRLEGAATFADDGALGVERMTLAASALRVAATGRVGADGALAAELTAQGLPASEQAQLRAKTLDASVRLAGSLSHPTAAVRWLVEDARAPFGRIGRSDGSLDLAAAKDGADRFDMSGAAQGSGLAFADRGLAEAIGETFSFILRGRANRAGDAEIDVAKLAIGAGEAAFAGRVGPSLVDGKASLTAPSLARFARLAGRDLRGALSLSAALTGAPKDETLTAVLDGAIVSPATGVAAVDGLLGRRVALGGSAGVTPGGGLRFDRLALGADHLHVTVDGAATRDASDIVATIALPDLHSADARLSGRADVEAKILGSLQKPDARLEAALTDVRAAGRAIPKLSLRADAHDLVGALDLVASLQGTIDGNAARGGAHVAKAGAGWKVEAVDVSVGRAALKGALALDAAGLASGRLTLAAPDLDDFSAFALQKLAGSLDADIALDGADGGQNIRIDAEGARIRAADASIERLSAKIGGRDLLRRPALVGDVAVDDVRAGGQAIARARLRAAPAEGGSALDLSAEAMGAGLAARGVLTPGEPLRFDLRALSIERGGRKIALASPTTITLDKGVVELKDFALAAGAGRLRLNGRIGERLGLVAEVRGLPLAIAAMADSSLALDGALDADARMEGPAAAPSGEWKIKLAKLSAPQTRTNGLPPIDISAHGALAGARTTLDADIALGSAGRIAVAGSAPLSATGVLDLAVKGAVDAKLADTALAAGGQTLRGKSNIDLRVSGAASAPQLAGAVTLRDGAFADPLNGVTLDHIDARLEGKGRELTIAQMTAQTRNGGRITVAGHIAVAPETGFPGAIHVTARNAQLVASDLVTATSDLDLDIGGALARAPRIAGRVSLSSMEVNVPDRLPASAIAPPGATHISPGEFARRMIALERKAKEKAGKKTSFDAAIDLAIAAPNRIFVRGRGIDAEFGGELKLAGTLQKPVANGAFELRRGRLQLLTQRIDISRGRLTFAGGLVPQLDFSAETTAADVTATIAVSGPAALPSFTFASTPSLPQDEVLSRLLFAKGSGSLSPFQAVQLAAALAQFSGSGTGVDAFEKMRRALGVDTLDLEAGGAGGPKVGASRYISDNISVGVRTGMKPEQTAVSVGVDVTKNVRLKGETRVDGKSSVGVGVEWEY
ncbi:translocation/assembly module TamB domain-containing protein [Methylosinus sp. Sm6]|uniref:translocation/assembly module TamB domain-containing protein n=1 Tax=Methylosinus sp. Sm6 TaxID=2866948 RepID=UPI001C9A1B04|nr:translocation/assembly module TamB domain-containing protein [Methylosinus sp. Sm6]MBY6239666.1 translocation/assembly module TamB domain-containing protein [Methylosinus sp. Sm6]